MPKLIITERPAIIEICFDDLVQLDLAATDFDVLTGEDSNINYLSVGGQFCADLELRRKLKHLTDVNVFDGQKMRDTFSDCFLESGVLTFRGRVKFTNYTWSRDVLKINFLFVGGFANVLNELPDSICDLDLGFHRNTEQGIRDIFEDDTPYNGTNPVWYSLKNYGSGLQPQSPYVGNVNVPVTYMRPDIHAAAIIEKLNTYLSAKIKSKYFDTEYFRRQLHPHVANGLNISFVEAELIAPINENAADQLIIPLGDASLFSISENNYQAIWQGAGALNSPDIRFNQWYNDGEEVTIKGNIEILNDQEMYIIAGVFDDSGTVTSGSQKISKDSPNFSITVEGVNKDHVIILFLRGSSGNYQIGIETQITVCIRTTQLKEGLKIFNNSIAKCEETRTYISGLSDTANLVWFYDEKRKCTIVEPKHDVMLPTGEFVQGFYKSFTTRESLVYECDKEEGNFNAFNVNRHLYFRFKEDDNDTRTRDTTFQHYEILNSKYPDEETEQTNEVFAATVLGRFPDNPDANNIPRIPVFQSWEDSDPNADTSAKYDFENRILYKHGNISGNWIYNGTQLLVYPLAAQIYDGINLGYGDVGFGSDRVKGIASNFYQSDFDLYNFAIVKTIPACIRPMQMLDLAAFFREPQLINNKKGAGKYLVRDVKLGIQEDVPYLLSEVVLISTQKRQ